MPGEILFERQDLPSVLEWLTRDEPQFRQGVENQPGGLELLDFD